MDKITRFDLPVVAERLGSAIVERLAAAVEGKDNVDEAVAEGYAALSDEEKFVCRCFVADSLPEGDESDLDALVLTLVIDTVFNK